MIEMEEVWKLVPSECPFCRAVDGKFWREFKVVAAEPFYADAGNMTTHSSNLPMELHVFCTRCEEEIRPEDVKRGV
jgi:hypothetical protein